MPGGSGDFCKSPVNEGALEKMEGAGVKWRVNRIQVARVRFPAE